MEKTISSQTDLVDPKVDLNESKNLDPKPESVDLRQRVPDLLLMLGLDCNELLREANFDDSQISKIYDCIRRSKAFISINFNHEVLDLPKK